MDDFFSVNRKGTRKIFRIDCGSRSVYGQTPIEPHVIHYLQFPGTLPGFRDCRHAEAHLDSWNLHLDKPDD
ncbi:hypothetical protein [Azospirillum doebereinerae]